VGDLVSTQALAHPFLQLGIFIPLFKQKVYCKFFTICLVAAIMFEFDVQI